LFESSWAYYAEQDAFDQLIQAALALGETGKQLQSTGAVAGLLQGVSLARLSNDEQTVNALTELLQEARDGTTFDESLPVLLQSLTGADGRFYELVVVSATPNFDEQLPAARIVGLIEEWISDIAPAHPNVDFGLTGDLVLAYVVRDISDSGCHLWRALLAPDAELATAYFRRQHLDALPRDGGRRHLQHAFVGLYRYVFRIRCGFWFALRPRGGRVAG
jgi:hypothetical protein